MNKPKVTHTEDIFTDYYKKYEDSTLQKRLNEKYAPKPYYSKYKSLKLIVLVSSYLFNTFSGITASTLIYFFALEITGYWIIASIITLCFIIILEISKRKVNSISFKDILQFKKLNVFLVITALLLAGMSISFSYYGSKRMVNQFSSIPTLLDKSTAVESLEAELSDVDRQIKDARGTKWRGTTTSKSQETIAVLSQQKLALQNEINRISNRIDQKNDATLNIHNAEVRLNAYHFALLTLLFELLFLLSTLYLEYYDYRSFAEFATLDKVATTDNRTSNQAKEEKEAVATDRNGVNRSVLEAAIKNAKANRDAYKAKLRKGEGSVATNEKGIKRWEAKIKELERMLPL